MSYILSGDPPFVNLTPQGALTHFSSEPARAKLTGQHVELASRLVCGAGGQSSNTVCALVPAGMAPLVQRKVVCRYTAGTGILTIETTGEIRFNTSLTEGQEIFLDNVSYYRTTSTT
jgi:hypothetical protein